METKIQAKAYFPEYCSTKDLNSDAANGMRCLYPEEKTLKNGQCFNSFLTWQPINGYMEYEKEKVRQTILKHELIFRHQLQELHHLYRRQREMMNEIKRRELNRHPILAETSQSSFFLSDIPSELVKETCHISNFSMVNSTFGRASTSGVDSIQSPLNFTKQKSMHSPFASQDRASSEHCGPLKSKCNMFQKRMFDLEIPADVYMNNEEMQVEERICGVPGVKVLSVDSNHEVAHNRDVNPSLGSGLKYNGDALISNLNLKRIHGMADLNEPAKGDETSFSASVDKLGDITCLKEKQRRDVFINSNSDFQEFSQSSLVGREGESSLNCLHLETGSNGKEQLTYNFKAGQTKLEDHSSLGGVSLDDSASPFKSLQVEPRTIFGVEISNGNHDQDVLPSHIHGIIPQTDVLNPESLSVSPRRKTSSTLGQNVASVQEKPCVNTFDPSSRNSTSLMQHLEFVEAKMQVGSKLKSIPSSRNEVSHQNGSCFGSQLDAKKLQGCCSSVGFDFQSANNANNPVSHQFLQYDLNSPEFVNLKSAKGLETNAETPYSFQNEVVPQQNPVFSDGQRNHKNCKGGLPWFLAKKNYDAEQTRGMENSCHMNLDSLQNYFEQFFHKAETGKSPSRVLIQDSRPSTSSIDGECMKVEVGDCPSSKKILGVPIFDGMHVSKDPISLSSSSKSSNLASDVYHLNTRKDLAQDLKSEDQLEGKDFVLEKGLNNYISDLRYHIDLNLSLNEEEASSAPSLPRAILQIATTEIDLEAPAVFEPEIDTSPKAVSPENEPSSDESKTSHEKLDRVAAEAIISISSSKAYTLLDDATSQPLETAPRDCLLWFAEVISSCKADSESKIMEASSNLNCSSDEGFIPDGMDYFEFMTLQLKDTKGEEYCYEALILENQKDEKIAATSLPMRPRRGQARRGRQRKDFQKDVLPGLVSLSRNEVTEDIQTFEELLISSGCTWQSSLSKRNASKRGRRRSGGQALSLTATVVCPPLIQQPIYRELGLQERSLTGWGKRTRRLPRQRCPSGNPTIVLKC